MKKLKKLKINNNLKLLPAPTRKKMSLLNLRGNNLRKIKKKLLTMQLNLMLLKNSMKVTNNLKNKNLKNRSKLKFTNKGNQTSKVTTKKSILTSTLRSLTSPSSKKNT